MDQKTLKKERDDALRQIGNVAGTLSPEKQADLNRNLRELVERILKKREAEERRSR